MGRITASDETLIALRVSLIQNAMRLKDQFTISFLCRYIQKESICLVTIR